MREHGGSTCRVWIASVVVAAVFGAPGAASAQLPTAPGGAANAAASVDNPLGVPDLRTVLPPATSREGISSTLQIVILLTLVSLAPAILLSIARAAEGSEVS